MSRFKVGDQVRYFPYDDDEPVGDIWVIEHVYSQEDVYMIGAETEFADMVAEKFLRPVVYDTRKQRKG